MEDESYVKFSSTQYVFLKNEFVKSNMFPITTAAPEDASFYDLHATSQETSVIICKENDQDMGMYFVIGDFESTEANSKGCIIIVKTEDKWSVQLVIFKNKSLRNKISRNRKTHDRMEKIDVDGSLDELCLRIYNTTHIVIPNKVGRNDEEDIARKWNEEFVGKRPFLKDGIDVSQRLKRKHVAIISNDCASKVVDYGTLETITYIEPNTTDVKRVRSLKMEATTLSYSDIVSSKESSKKTSNLREEAVSLIEGAFTQNWSPEDFVLGFKNLKKKGLEPNQLAATSAKMLMDSSYRIIDSTPIEEDVIEDVSIDVDQVSKAFI